MTRKLRKLRKRARKIQGSGKKNNHTPLIGEDLLKEIFRWEYSGQPFRVALREPIMNQAIEASFGQLLSDIMSLADRTFVDVSISKNSLFSSESHFTKKLTIDEFIAYSGEFHLYLAQIPLVQKLRPCDFYNYFPSPANKLKIDKHFQSQLEGITNVLRFPEVVSLKCSQLEVINVWANKSCATSQWHFDAYDNYLAVVKGRKIVRLLDCNQTGLVLTDNDFSMVEQRFKDSVIECELMPQQVLRIPEGWLHCVVSDAETVAFNFWFTSALEKSKKLFPIFLSHYLTEFDQNQQLDKIRAQGKYICPEKVRRKFLNALKKHAVLRDEVYSNLRTLVDIIDAKINFASDDWQSKFTDESKERFYEILDSQKIRSIMSKLEKSHAQRIFANRSNVLAQCLKSATNPETKIF